VGCQAASDCGRGIACRSRALLYRARLAAAARDVLVEAAWPGRYVAVAARARSGSIDCRRPQQQGDERYSRSQREDDRSPPRCGDAQAERHLDGRHRALCHSKQARRAVGPGNGSVTAQSTIAARSLPLRVRHAAQPLKGPLLVALAYFLGAEAAFYIGTLSDQIFALFWPPNVILF